MTQASARVPEDLDGERIDRIVAHLGGVSRAASRRLIESGDVAVNGVAVQAPAQRLREGDEVLYREPTAPEPLRPEPVAFDVVWEDEHLSVIDKPPGIVTHPGAGNPAGTLAAGILHRWPGIAGVGAEGRWGIVLWHRLAHFPIRGVRVWPGVVR